MNDVRNYLLGLLDEATAESIETRALQDDEFFETIRSAEDDLFDEFARRELNAAERDAFVQRFGDQADRIRFAGALAKRPANAVAFPIRAWIGWAAAAVIAIAITATLVIRQPASRPADIHQQLLRSMTVTLAIGSSRSASEPAHIVVPNDVSTVDLHVRLNPADRYEKYVITLRSKRVSWGSGDVHASNEGSDLIVTANVPAKVLEAGSYELAVSANGEELGFAMLEVSRNK